MKTLSRVIQAILLIVSATASANPNVLSFGPKPGSEFSVFKNKFSFEFQPRKHSASVSMTGGLRAILRSMLLTTDNTIQQGTTKVMTFDPANITPIVDGAAGPGMWYLFQFQDPNYVMVASSGEPAGWQISVDTTSLPVRVTATCPLNFSGPYSLSIGISQAQANQLTALGFNVGAANGLGVNIVVAPLQFSVPAQIVPNPPFGILPDPMTFPMWMGDVAPSDSPDSPNGGPASVIETELVHGVATVDSGPDLVIANSIGPDFVFERTYRTAMAAGNLSSPGLTPGWTHNWDYRIAVTGTQNGWAKTLQLVYPNGASDILTPVLDGNNQPTGTLNVPAGAQYRAIGVPDLNAGIWTSITIQSNGVSKSIFTVPSGDTYMRLTSKVFDNGSQVNLSYSASKLTLVDNGAGNSFAVNYAGNLISSVSNSLFSRNFNYVSGKLQSATRINSSAIEWSYSYLSIGGQPYISTVGTTDPAGNNVSASIGYESITGRVQSVTDSKNNPRGYIYNPAGGASITVGPSNSVLDQFSKACDTLGRQSSVTDRGGAITSFAYGAPDPSIVTTVTPPSGLGHPTVLSNQDTHGNMQTLTTAYGNSTVSTWEYPAEAPFGRVKIVQEFGKAGEIHLPTNYAYYGANDPDGPLGFLKTVTYPLGGTLTYTYTAMGNVAKITGIDNVTYDYTHPLGGGTLPELYGRPYKVLDANLKATGFTYDPAGRLNSVTDSLGNTTSSVYNEYGQVSSVSMPGSKSLSIAYGVNGKAPSSVTLTSPTGTTQLAQTQYDSESGASSMADANLNSNSVSLDAKFDLNTLTNANSKQMHQFTPDTLNRKVKTQVGTGNKSTTFQNFFSMIGNPTGFQEVPIANAQMTTSGGTIYRTNDDANMVATTNSTNINSQFSWRFDTGYTYDPFGRILTAQSTGVPYNIQHTYTYDDEDNLKSDTVSSTSQFSISFTLNSRIDYTYNIDNTLHTMHVHTSNSLQGVMYTYGYDLKHQVTSIQANSEDSTGGLGAVAAFANYKYDDLGRVTVVRTNKAVTVYAYDSENRLTRVQNLSQDGFFDSGAPPADQVPDPDNITIIRSILSSFTNLTYDDKGNRTGMDLVVAHWDAFQNNPIVYLNGHATWSYDSGSRLKTETWTGAFGPTRSYTHNYDNAYNLTTLRSTTFNVDSFSDQLTNSAAPYNNVLFDSLGERTNWAGDTTHTISAVQGWDPTGQLTRVTGPSFATFGAGGINTTQTNCYDDMGRRLVHYVDSYTSTSVSYYDTFVYSGSDLIKRRAPGNTLVAGGQNTGTDLSGSQDIYYIVGPTGPVVEFDFGATSIGINPGGGGVSQKGPAVDADEEYFVSTNVRSITYDPQGSCVAAVSGNIQDSPWLLYDAYGKPVWTNTATNDTNFNGLKLLNQPFQYKGQYGYYADGHTGTYYCMHRFYDPGSGRWLSRDPAGLEGGVNTYSYCDGNPVMRADPSGLEWTFFGFEFSLEVWGNGLGTGGAATLHVLSAGHYTSKWAESQTGYNEAVWLAERGVDAASMAVGEGVFLKAGQLYVKGKAAYQTYKVAKTMANVRRLGKAGETTVAAIINIGAKTAYRINGRLRIADGLTKTMYSEIKNVASLSKTQQITDGLQYAEQIGAKYNLFIRASTKLSGPLQKLIDAGRITVHRIL